jgi:predicted DNA-binding transcriptional regulator AlpA
MIVMTATSLTEPSPLDFYRMLDETAAAHVLGISTMTLRRMSKNGEGPERIKISPRRVGYRLRDCVAWLERKAG